MNRSLLRTYALFVCVTTGFSVILIAGIPLWHALVHSAQAIEQHEVYQFYEQQNKAGCADCNTTRMTELSPSAPATISHYQPAVAPEPEQTTSGFTDWLPPWVFVALRIIIGLVGILIFTVHWRLYKNLGFAH